jgi:hypothetical protein
MIALTDAPFGAIRAVVYDRPDAVHTGERCSSGRRVELRKLLSQTATIIGDAREKPLNVLRCRRP